MMHTFRYIVAAWLVAASLLPLQAQSFLPGLYPGGATTGGALTLSVAGSSTSTASTISTPAGVRAGDLLVLNDYGREFGGVSAVVPTGFTQIGQANSSADRMITSYKIADGTETTITGMNGSTGNDKQLYMFRGSAPITAIVVSAAVGYSQSSGGHSQNVLASGGTAPLIVMAAYATGGAGSVDPRTFSPAKDGEINSSTRAYLAHKIYNTGPQDVNAQIQAESTSNYLASFYLEAQ